MVEPSDIRRARASLEEVLRRRQLDRKLALASGNASLTALLETSSRRRARQVSRLLDWLKRHGGEAVPAPLSPQSIGSNPSGAEPPSAAREADGVKVTDVRLVTPDLVRFMLAKPEGFTFVPGQSVKVGLGGIQRSYSIVSAPHETHLEFFVELVAGGRMSEQLRRLRPGDAVTLGRPKGGFRFDEGYPHHLMIATVTGINPFVSILRDYAQVRLGVSKHHFHLLHGASFQTEFGYREELEALAARHPGLLTYVPTVSRPDDPVNRGWEGRRGRVDALIDDYLIQAGLGPADTLVYACGHGAMLDLVRERYGARGFRVVTESYD